MPEIVYSELNKIKIRRFFAMDFLFMYNFILKVQDTFFTICKAQIVIFVKKLLNSYFILK